MTRPAFPFAAIVGQDEMKTALLLAAVDRKIGGVMVFGDRGTGKSTAARGLAQLLPPLKANRGCRYNCDPADIASLPCPDGCRAPDAKRRAAELRPVPFVDLPLSSTEDRVVGALDLERALARGEKAFEPGLLARAHRGFLYIDEVNLLEDHIVDLLLDVAVSGENLVEREGLSVRHAARFLLIGSGNPEEGELRPQLLDRFGLSVEVRTPETIADRIEIVRRADAFDRDGPAFRARFADEEAKIGARVKRAAAALPKVGVPDAILDLIARLCSAVGADGLRGELTLMRSTRALAAFEGDRTVNPNHIARMAGPALRHRLRKNPLDDTGSGARIARALAELVPGVKLAA